MAKHDIGAAVETLRARIATLERRYGREAGSVTLLAVSKTKPPEAVRAALAAGQHAFGENHLQDAMTKVEALAGQGVSWHFIGAVQSNKTRPIAAHFDWVHGIEREKIATRLSAQRPADRGPLDVCIEVNVSREASKSGVSPADVEALARLIRGLPGLRLRGLMAIPRAAEDFETQRIPFRLLREILDDLNTKGLELDTLSMGMTADLEAAVAEGATIVRIGRGTPRPAGGDAECHHRVGAAAHHVEHRHGRRRDETDRGADGGRRGDRGRRRAAGVSGRLLHLAGVGAARQQQRPHSDDASAAVMKRGFRKASPLISASISSRSSRNSLDEG